MGKIVRRVLILFLVFVLGVAGTALLLNSESTDDRSDMNDPTFPEVMVEYGGKAANRMCGYAQVMQADFVRDSVTPLDTTKKLTFLINSYTTKVNSLSYEIRTSDGSKVIENRKIKNLASSESYKKATVEISSNLLMSQEYSMQITLDTNKGEIYYYTRIVSRPGLNTEHYVEFAHMFYENCLDKHTAEDLANYLEPVDKGSPTNFANININSSLSEVSWGSLAPKLSQKGIPVIKDINETTASLELEYQIRSKNEEGYTELYDVREFYRLRYSETRIRLLNFERSTQQIFDPVIPVISNSGLKLGVRDKNVSYMTDEEGTIVAFTQQGDLFSYTPDNGKIVRIFSFRREESSDFRDSRGEHDIKLIRVQGNGDVDFVLYGYMNRGIHEGYTGVCVYHYDSGQNVLEEKVFIPSVESFEFLEADMGVLSYISEGNCLYLMLAQKLYEIDIEQGTFNILEEKIRTRYFAVSETNAHAAWKVASGKQKGSIKTIDFDSGETKILTSPAGGSLSLQGFMNEDLVYGVVLDGDVLKNKAGKKIEGMSSLKIEAFDGTLKKEYQIDGHYISNVSIGPILMEFDLYSKSKETFKFVKKDNIVNNAKAGINRISIELLQVSKTGTQVRLSFGETPKTKYVLRIASKMKTTELHEIMLDTQIPDEGAYYVYAKGGLDQVYLDPAAAIQYADEEAGVVLNRRQQYVWERGNKKTKQMLQVEDLPETMKEGNWDAEALQEELKENGSVMDLSGCTLDSVLYEVSMQRPVMVKLGGKSVVVIIGYDEYNTYLYHPESGETEIYGMNDSTKLFEKSGNLFLTYIEKAAY